MSILVSSINRKKYDITLVLIKKEGRYLNDLPSDLDIIDLNCYRVRYSIFKIVKLLYKIKPNVVFSTLSYLNLLLAILRPLFPSDMKFIARESNTVSVNNKQQPYPRIFNCLYRLFYNNFDTLIAQAKFMRNDLISNFGINHNKIKVIYNPIDFERVETLSLGECNDYRQGCLKLLAVGSFTKQKGFDLLLRSVQLLKVDFHLIILGQGSNMNALRQLASDLNLAGKVDFLGFKTNPFAYMRNADFLVLSSRYEGLPNVVLEANACGTPVVAFDCPGGGAEIIKEGVNGCLADCEDIGMLARAITAACYVKFDSNNISAATKFNHSTDNIIPQYEVLF